METSRPRSHCAFCTETVNADGPEAEICDVCKRPVCAEHSTVVTASFKQENTRVIRADTVILCKDDQTLPVSEVVEIIRKKVMKFLAENFGHAGIAPETVWDAKSVDRVKMKAEMGKLPPRKDLET